MFDMVKKGMWIKVKGSVQMDQYKHELVLSARGIWSKSRQKRSQGSHA